MFLVTARRNRTLFCQTGWSKSRSAPFRHPRLCVSTSAGEARLLCATSTAAPPWQTSIWDNVRQDWPLEERRAFGGRGEKLQSTKW